MEIYPTIEALLHYANAHLLFDELDYVYARNRIMSLMGINDYEEYEINDDELETMDNPDEILEILCSYAVAQKVIAPEEKDCFARRLMSTVIKRPSEVADMFMSLPMQKAFEWLGDFGVKSGYIKPVKKWEAKATKNKLEAIFTGIDSKKGEKYPACDDCRDNEGYKRNINMRSVPIELYGERMFFSYSSTPCAMCHGIIVDEYHRPLTINKVALEKMFDFINLMPSWVIAAREGEHESYTVTARLLPFHKAGEVNKFKSKDYPYINICTTDWYIGTIRMSHTNREKMIEYTDKLISMWKAHGRDVAVSLRKIESQYCVELMLFSAKGKLDNATIELFNLDKIMPLLGVFSFSKTDESNFKHIERFLTKAEKYAATKLPENLIAHADMIARLIAAQGSGKVTELEASLDVKDEIGRCMENALIALAEPLDMFHGNF